MIHMIITKITEKFYQLQFFRWFYKLKIKELLAGGDCGRSAIVMFHHVRDDEAIDILNSCKSTTKELLGFCDYLRDNRQVVSIHELVEKVNYGKAKDMVVVSFDDVPQNFYTTAFPILKEYGFPFILYIATGFLDKEGYLTSEQVIELSKDSLCTIGCHTFSHIFLKDSKDLEREVITCKIELEQLIGLKIVDFAYPYGTPIAIDRKVISYVAKTNLYETAVITVPGLINKLSIRNKFAMPRIHSKLFMQKYI